MTTATPVYSALVTHTITLASLATSSTLLAGQFGTAIDQKDSDDAIDALVGGLITVGTTPTANTQIEAWLYSSFDDTVYSESTTSGTPTIDGTDGAATLLSKATLRLMVVIPVTATTSNVGFKWGPFSVAQAYGGIIPVQWGVFITHNTGVNLNSTGGNHYVKHYPVKYESA
jgi:hypothetical protein